MINYFFKFIKGLLCIKYTNVDTSEMIIAQKSFSDQQTDILIRESYYSSPATTLNSLIIKLYRLYSDTYWGKLKFNKNVDGMGAYCQSVDVLLRVQIF